MDRPSPVPESNKENITMTCQIESGNPKILDSVRWFLDGDLLKELPDPECPNTINDTQNQDIRSSHNDYCDTDPIKLMLQNVEQKFTGNYSCQGRNKAGWGPESLQVELEVYGVTSVPPTFLEQLPPYTGKLWNADVSLTCRVQCSPVCEIFWLKGWTRISRSSIFSISSTVISGDRSQGVVDSVLSTLTWNWIDLSNRGMTWNRDAFDGRYTCQTTSNRLGAGVSSSTEFRFEYPPKEMWVSRTVVHVVEGEIPDEIKCSASGSPQPIYSWVHNERIVSNHDVLRFEFPVMRSDAGNYTCIARNQHGNASIESVIDVQHIPECKITIKGSRRQFRALYCEVTANPDSPLDIQWMLDGVTLPGRLENILKLSSQSQLILNSFTGQFGNFTCFANNSVGMSSACEYIIPEPDVMSDQDSAAKPRTKTCDCPRVILPVDDKENQLKIVILEEKLKNEKTRELREIVEHEKRLELYKAQINHYKPK